MATSGYKSVSRIDSRRAVGWYVRVKFNRENHAKFFTDNVHGGKDTALEAAIKWRNKKERELGKPRTDRTVTASFLGNNTGHIGVVRTKKWTGARDNNGDALPNYSDVYVVSWSAEPGKPCATSISVEKYGEKEARRRAIDLRKSKEREIYGQEIDFRNPKRVKKGSSRRKQRSKHHHR